MVLVTPPAVDDPVTWALVALTALRRAAAYRSAACGPWVAVPLGCPEPQAVTDRAARTQTGTRRRTGWFIGEPSGRNGTRRPRAAPRTLSGPQEQGLELALGLV